MTTAAVAAFLGVSEPRVRNMVREGKLNPLVPGSRPLTFREADVVEYELAHRRDRERVSRLAAEWRACLQSAAK